MWQVATSLARQINRLVLGLALGAGCAGPPRQYTLRVDVADQGKTQLCERQADGKVADEPTCAPFGAQGLHTPSTLTVKLDNQAQGAKYDLRVAQFSREASKSDAQAIAAEVTRRVATFVGAAAGTTTRVGELLGEAAERVKAEAPRIAAVVATKLGAVDAPAPARPPREPGALFKIKDGKLPSAADLRANGELTPLNAPGNPPPFPRAITIDGADLKALPVTVTIDQVAAAVAEWCTADSFVQTKDKARWAAVYKALEAAPDASAVRAKLAPKLDDIVQYLASAGGVDPLASVIEPLIDAGERWAAAHGDAGAAAAARELYLMRLGKTVQSSLRHCDENISVLKAAGAKTDLDAPAKSVTALRAAATRYAAAFDEVFGPVLQRTIVAAERTIDLSFGSTTITLEPGQLELGVGVTPTGGQRAEVATYKVKTNGIERLAVLVAPTATLCSWGCFDHFEQVARRQGDGMVRSVIDRSGESYDLSLVTALHVTMYSWEHWGLGAVVGYPIGTQRDTRANFVVGAGVRHESGVELAIGVHGMLSKQLKAGYDAPLDLTTAGYENLTPDVVTRDVPRLGVFVLIGFAPSVLNALNN
jgi:hypothetical protein